LINESKKIITFENLIGKKIAIDAFNTLYQFLAIIRGVDGSPLKDLQGNVTSHLSGIFNRTINLLEKDIKPIFVFDGPPNPFKKAEIERRRQIKREATQKMHEAQDLEETEEIVKFAQATSSLNSDMINESKVLLTAMGIPIIEAAQDGEAQAAYLVQKDFAWGVGSQDYDALLFGAPKIVRNLSQNRQKKVRNTVVNVDLEWLSLAKFLEENAINQDQLVDIGILTGVDFFPGIEGVGAKTALKLILEHGSIEKILESKVEVHKHPIELDLAEIQKVRDIFLKPTVNTDVTMPKWHRPDVEKIKEILIETHNFNRERVEAALSRLSSASSTQTQRTMDSFLGSFSSPSTKSIPSKKNTIKKNH
jgi:flap endonuclease-1